MCKILLDALATCPKMEYLYLSLNGVGDSSIIKICAWEHLKYLDLSGNNYTDIGMAEIARMISRPGNNLLTMDLRCSFDITDIGAIILADAMKSEHCCLESIEIYGSELLTNESSNHLADVCKLRGIDMDIDV